MASTRPEILFEEGTFYAKVATKTVDVRSVVAPKGTVYHDGKDVVVTVKHGRVYYVARLIPDGCGGYYGAGFWNECRTRLDAEEASRDLAYPYGEPGCEAWVKVEASIAKRQEG